MSPYQCEPAELVAVAAERLGLYVRGYDYDYRTECEISKLFGPRFREDRDQLHPWYTPIGSRKCSCHLGSEPVGDILVLYGSKLIAADGRAELVGRPGMHHHEIHEYTYSWGCVIAQQSKGRWYAPVQRDGRLTIPIGRPVVRGYQLEDAPDAMASWVHSQQGGSGLAENASRISDELSGMYAFFECSESGVSILTDHMGFRPVYVARDDSGCVLGMGTHVESLAAATGLQSQIDLVSIGELITYNYITFPYTTRTTIRELDSCSITVYVPSENRLTSKVLWEPEEPAVFPERSAIGRRLKEAMIEAADDVSRGCDRVGVLLSGGFDSRAVIGVLPRDRVAGALTYVTRENRETRVAGDVAKAAGTEQILVRRDDDYFPNLVSRGLNLLGMELRGNCHGLCIADNDLGDSFDVIVGGQLSDTLLKDHFMSLPRRESFRGRTIKSRIRELLKGPVPTPIPSTSHTTGRGALETELIPEIRDQVRARRETRLSDVQRVRPTTADEWVRFWPCSRQDDSAHTLGNTRIMCSDTLFAHQAIVEVARDYAPELRVDGKVTDGIFVELCGGLARIMNANTGLPADASRRAIRKKRKKDRNRKRNQMTPPSDGWNDVETSWVDPVLMQQQSAIWNRYRARLGDSPAVAQLSRVVERGGEQVVGAYQEDLPSTFNHMVMQLAIWLDGLIVQEHPLMDEAAR